MAAEQGRADGRGAEAPRVSVVVPVRDGAGRIDACLAALRAQSYPEELVQIVVVDNASVDDTRGRVRRHGIAPLVEHGGDGPQRARNAGLRHARGEVLAFTDADCVPAKDWLERGVEALRQQQADLVAGRVRFTFSQRPTCAELLDAVTHLDQERSVALRACCKATNLFVARGVFDEIGEFPEGWRSSSDVAFTSCATRVGFHLAFAERAVVDKPARGAWALARKHYRVGRADVRLWREAGTSGAGFAGALLRGCLPRNPLALRRALRARGPEGSRRRWPCTWWTSGWLDAFRTLGRLRQWLLPGRGA